MLKLQPYVARLVRWLSAADGGAPAMRPDDPFSDPRLRTMTLAQLADLPFDRPPMRER